MRLVFLFVVLLIATPSHSYENRWYWGGGVLSSKTEYYGEDQIRETHLDRLTNFQFRGRRNATVGQSQIDFEDSDTSYSAFIGVRFHENFDWEFTYINFGEFRTEFKGRDFTVVDFDETNLVVDYEIEGLNITLQWRAEIAEDLELMFRGGLLWWDGAATTAYTATGTDGNDLPTRYGAENDRGYDESFGAGLMYRFGEDFAVRAHWDSFTLGLDRTDVVSLTFQTGFWFK